jgi:hypothetical protein
MIKVYFLLAFLILLSRSVQVSAQKINIFVSGTSNSKTAEAIENHLKQIIATLLMDQYPCAGNLTDDDAAASLAWARERELMGNPDEDAISNVASALGAQFVVSVNVSQINSTIAMFANGLDNRRGKPVSKQASVVQSEGEAVDAAESLAEKFVSDFINSLPDCYVNEWVGTITYSRVLQGQSRTTEEGFSVSGTTTTEISTKSTADANFEVRGTKKPARATVKWNEETLKNAITKQTLTCPGTTLFEQGKTVTRNVTEAERTTGKAEGKVDAVASVSVDGDEYTISFTVPEIDDGVGVRDWTLEDSGGCGQPWSDHESNSVKWTSPELYEQAKGKIDHSKPDILAGSQTVKGGSSLAPSMEQTTIITWDLNFKRDPSTRK